MKHLLFLWITAIGILWPMISRSQELGSTFFGPDAMRYKDSTVTLVASPMPYIYFMLDKSKAWNEPGNVYLPSDDLKNPQSDPQKIFGKLFLVSAITPDPNAPGHFFFELIEKKSNQHLYYYYNPDRKNVFCLRVVNLLAEAARAEALKKEKQEEKDKDYCSLIEVKKDKFTGEVTYNNPYQTNRYIGIYKVVTKAKQATYYLSLHTTSDVVSTGEKGVIILLSNKKKIVRPVEEVEVEVSRSKIYGSGDFEYSVFMRLSAAERALLMSSRITDFRLYVYDQEIEEEEGAEFVEYMKCIVDRN